MGDSILTTIKKMLGLAEDYTSFDMDVLVGINTAIMILSQLGIGPVGGITVLDKSSIWAELLSNETRLEAVKSYIHMKVRLMFDPPTNGAVIEAYERAVVELEWRLATQASELAP